MTSLSDQSPAAPGARACRSPARASSACHRARATHRTEELLLGHWAGTASPRSTDRRKTGRLTEKREARSPDAQPVLRRSRLSARSVLVSPDRWAGSSGASTFHTSAQSTAGYWRSTFSLAALRHPPGMACQPVSSRAPPRDHSNPGVGRPAARDCPRAYEASYRGASADRDWSGSH